MESCYRNAVVAGEVLVLVATGLVVLWFMHFDTGLDWNNADCAHKPCVFNYHPILMVLGFGVLGFNGIVCWRVLPFERPVRKGIHLGLQTGAFVLACIGVRAVFNFHNYHDPPIANLYSLHSWIGLTAMILWAMNLAAAFYFFVTSYAPLQHRRAFMPIHIGLALAVYLLALIAMITGIQEKLGFYQGALAYAKKPAMSMIGNLAGLCLVAMVALFIAIIGTIAPRLKAENQAEYSQVPESHTDN